MGNFKKRSSREWESSRVISLKPQNRSMWVKCDVLRCKSFKKKKQVQLCDSFSDSEMQLIWASALLAPSPLRLKVTLKNSFLLLLGAEMPRPHGCCCFHELPSARFAAVAGREARQTQLPSIFALTRLKGKTKTRAYGIKMKPTGARCNERWNSQGNYLNLYAWPKFVACC